MMRSIITIVILTTALACGPATGVAAQDVVDRQDSTTVFGWAGVFSSNLEKYRLSHPFSWNAPESEQWSDGRLGVDLRLYPVTGMEMMMRVSAGSDGPVYDRRGDAMQLEQGHVALALEQYGLYARLFLRERLFRTGNRLMLPISSDSPLLDGQGEGMNLAYSPSPRFEITFTGSSLPAGPSSLKHGGLPVLYGWGGSFNFMTLRSKAGFFDAGMFISERRSPHLGDGVLSGIDIGLTFLGYRLQIEASRSEAGRLADQTAPLFSSLTLDRLRAGNISEAFSDNDAFSMELQGLVLSSGKYGTLGLIPGYDYSGADFDDPQGEIGRGRVESRFTAWWRHPERALSVFLQGADTYDPAGSLTGKNLRATMRSRFRSGLETTAGVILVEDEDPAVIVSMLEDSRMARIMATARVDAPGGENGLSFMTEGHLNISGSITLRSVLYLERSLNNLYCLQLEYRSGKRYLFRAGMGTFTPTGQSMGLVFEPYPAATGKERYISFFARIALGDI